MINWKEAKKKKYIEKSTGNIYKIDALWRTLENLDYFEVAIRQEHSNLGKRVTYLEFQRNYREAKELDK